MPVTSSTKYHGTIDRGAAVSPYITLSILVAGVAGGVIIVIAVILFCKYCVKKKNGLRRDQSTDRERSSDRRFKPFQRYETINSDIFSEPSTGSMDGIPISPRRIYEARSHEKLPSAEEVNETTKLKSDFDRASYKETDLGDEEEACQDVRPTSDPEEEEPEGRRVSFQLDNVQTTTSNYLRKGRRYTDGDFHYLKNMRINKRVACVPRQYSLGAQTYRDTRLNMEELELPTIPSADEPLDELNTKSLCFYEKETSFHSNDSPSPTNGPVTTQVAVELHYPKGMRDADLEILDSLFAKSHYLNGKQSRILKPHSYSMDAVSPTSKSSRTNRRVKSYDDVLDYDYDVLKITEFSKGPFYNTDFDVISETESPGSSSKVRYNDMGSLEVLNEDNLDNLEFCDEYNYENIIPDESDDTETLNGTQKYREIWNLRTTLEEEEECSDTIRMEDMASLDEQSPDQEVISYNMSSFESNIEPMQHSEERVQNGELVEGCEQSTSTNYLHPNYENRRQDYKSILTRRLQKKPAPTSAENSFDSVETVDTDGDISDTSRQEVTTTSFESTTDNTDSTNDSQTSKLRQMKADSGYKSLETQTTHPCTNGIKKAHSLDDEILPYEPDVKAENGQDSVLNKSEIVRRRSSKFEKRQGRTASKRRREYSRERQACRIYGSVYEPETDSKSDQPSGDSFDEPLTPSSKFSVFSRFFRSQGSKEYRDKVLSRDYSIDEKTNNIFQEFLRYDPIYDGKCGAGVGLRLSPRTRRSRLHRKYTDPGVYEDRRRDRLAPEMRSTSLGSDSSASSVRRLSPQDSIEEEEFEDDEEAQEVPTGQVEPLLEESPMTEVSTPALSIHEIPIIKLPEGESADV